MDAPRRLRAGEAIPAGEYDALLLAIRSGATLPRSSGRSAAAESPPPAAAPPPAPVPAPASAPSPAVEGEPVAAEQRAVARAPDSANAQDAGDEQLRVGARRLDGLTAAAAELREMSSTVASWPEELEAMRIQLQRWSTTWKREGRADVAAVNTLLTEVARNLAALERDIQEQARGADTVSLRLIESARHIRQRPFGDIAQPLARVGRDVGVQTGKTVRVIVTGERVEADRTVLEALREPLIHLVRNAADHGLETPAERARAGKPPEGTVRIEAALRGDRLTVTVGDDGRGLDVPAIRAALARKGRPVPTDEASVVRSLLGGQISTRTVATEISGRGVGLD